MSLEETLSRLVDAVNANTDAMLHLASSYRQAPSQPAGVNASTKTSENATASTPAASSPPSTEKPKRLKAPPPAPADLASPETSPPAAAPTASTPASVPAAASGSEDADGTYADLQQLVPEYATKHGRKAAMELFAKLGVTSGTELQKAEHAAKVPEAVRLFRAGLQ